jgi:cysteine-rich repeat protein
MRLLHRFGSLSVLFALSANVGCNQILDIKDHPVGAGSGGETATGGSGGHGTGGVSGAGHSGSGGNSGHGGSTGGAKSSTGGAAGQQQTSAGTGAGATGGSGGTGGTGVRGGTGGTGGMEAMAGAGEAGQGGEGGPPAPVCGNGKIDGNDVCDDGNTTAGDGCSPTCQIEAGWICDASGCTEICGDGLVVGKEAKAGGCDDMNAIANDGCTNCAVDPSYFCSGAPSVCAKTCGNGMLDGTEACDDGNTTAGDGCFACAIESGFTCDTTKHPTTCADINECAPGGGNNCDANAACTNTIGSFTCKCNTGYSGSGTTCTDVNECAAGGSNNCNANANCTNTAGSFSCACKSGFTGNGTTTCTDIDECQAGGGNNCNANATCTNTPGSFSCACKTGYTGNGTTTCTDVDECQPGGGNNCSANANCANTTGSFTCTCKTGYMGNGVTCNACNCANGYSCSSTACKTSCSSDSDCVSDHFCSGTTCRSDAVSLSVSYTHGCIALADGTARCWGKNDSRQLGNTGTADSAATVQVQSLTTAKIMAAGDTVSYAVLANGNVMWWGKRETDYDYTNSAPIYTTSSTPVQIANLGNTTDLVTATFGDGATCALVNDKTVHCWGSMVAYNGSSGFFSMPTDIGLIGVTGISGGASFNCASLSGGGVKCWGFGIESQALGTGASYAYTPVVVGSDSGCTSPSICPYTGTISKVRSGDYFSCALKSTGEVDCWGSNQYHQLGPNGGGVFSTGWPLPVDGLSSVKDLTGGAENACAIDTSGGIKCWGDDSYGQLGDGVTSVGSGGPSAVQHLAGLASAVELGGESTCAILQNGSVQCWGRSIGDLSSSPVLTPITVW